MTGPIDSARYRQGRRRCLSKRAPVSTLVVSAKRASLRAMNEPPLESDQEFLEGISPHTRVLDDTETEPTEN